MSLTDYDHAHMYKLPPLCVSIHHHAGTASTKLEGTRPRLPPLSPMKKPLWSCSPENTRRSIKSVVCSNMHLAGKGAHERKWAPHTRMRTMYLETKSTRLEFELKPV